MDDIMEQQADDELTAYKEVLSLLANGWSANRAILFQAMRPETRKAAGVAKVWKEIIPAAIRAYQADYSAV